MTLTDASPLFALVDKTQPHHARCKGVMPRLLLPLITTWPCFAEAMYLAYRAGGWPLQRLLWQFVQDGVLVFHDLNAEERQRMPILMEKYRDIPMDMADASLVVAAETLNVTRIFTLDSDFYVYQINDKKPFEVLP